MGIKASTLKKQTTAPSTVIEPTVTPVESTPLTTPDTFPPPSPPKKDLTTRHLPLHQLPQELRTKILILTTDYTLTIHLENLPITLFPASSSIIQNNDTIITPLTLITATSILTLFPEKWSQSLSRHATTHLPLLKTVHETLGNVFTSDMLDATVARGDLETSGYLIHVAGVTSKYAARIACTNGTLDMVRMLYESSIPFTKHAMTCAAIEGHLDVVEFLYTRGEGCFSYTVSKAAEWGHAGVVAYLGGMGVVYDEYDVMRKAAKGGWVDVLRVVAERKRVVEYLVEEVGVKCPREAEKVADELGHEEVGNEVEGVAEEVGSVVRGVIGVEGESVVV
ncbi:hypothetical protein BC829DRAFT_487245 [Chytridium lagenaria]|nr:hypothetical protein BC829DRAFT_487245 [Chytridium lagenaria]